MTWNRREFTKKLEHAVLSFDRVGATALCGELVSHLRTTPDIYPLDDAKSVLGILRKKRLFTLLQQVSDALIQTGQDAPVIRLYYAQSQLDQSNLTAAIGVLERLVRDTAKNPKENAEAKGLLGRAYKQLYIDARDPTPARNQLQLEQAIKYYRDVYISRPENLWHGINGVALLRRAEADGVQVPGVVALHEQASAMATEILAAVQQLQTDEKADKWARGTAMEACIALGLHDEALEWLGRYIGADYSDAFEFASTHRQLEEVWGLTPAAPPGDRILPVLRSALLRCEGGRVDIAASAPSEGAGAMPESVPHLERILGQEGFKTYQWYATGMLRAGGVARIEDLYGVALGTGFLVRGGDFCDRLGDELLLLTNAHVVSPDPEERGAVLPEKAIVNFELDGAGGDVRIETVLWTSTAAKLDATLARLKGDLGKRQAVPLASRLPAREANARVYVIGHPGGRSLSFSLYDNALLDYDERLIHYRAPTEHGSSGSPVLDDDWQLVGLHHAGYEEIPRLNHGEGCYAANEGILLQAIRNEVKQLDLVP